MSKKIYYRIAILFLLVTAAVLVGNISWAQPTVWPRLKTQSVTPSVEMQSIVLAGGCFWGAQVVYQHLKGVKATVAGYAGGEAATANYETIHSGTTGHAEAVQITYDPSQISLEQILKVYFLVAHHPTELDYQGPDIGTQYRSAIFAATPEQKKIAENVIAQLREAKAFSAPIVTAIEPLKAFYSAEGYHQNYVARHPENPYVRVYDLPKASALQKKFPELYID
jgi:peptide-methionine (S)-S-oxide reductase